jgi:3-deoxy-D-manno-octulosonic-acid transferase
MSTYSGWFLQVVLDRNRKGLYRHDAIEPLTASSAIGDTGLKHLAPYNVLLGLSALVLGPYYGLRILATGKYRKSIGGKLGRVDGRAFEALGGAPRIWLHAVSVGEVTAAAPIITSLRTACPGASLLLSTSTETGQEMARRVAGDADLHFYYPLDLPWVARRVMGHVRPDVFVLLESEFWPNLIDQCRGRGTPVVLVNGRISPRSFHRYRKSRFFWKEVLRSVDHLGMISLTDAERIRAFGGAPERISVEGNAKFDGLAARVSPALREEAGRKLQIGEETPVFVAGSTHRGEEEAVLNAYSRIVGEFPGMVLVLVPRHTDRREAVLRTVRTAGFNDVITLSEMNEGRTRRGERVIVVDVIGELFKIYGLATVVFCGGSLVPKGGQNILEAAAWGKVVFYGPSMEDFPEEQAVLEESGAGRMVGGADALCEGILNALRSPETLARDGRKGREAILRHRGASDRYAGRIVEALQRSSRGIQPSALRR